MGGEGTSESAAGDSGTEIAYVASANSSVHSPVPGATLVASQFISRGFYVLLVGRENSPVFIDQRAARTSSFVHPILEKGRISSAKHCAAWTMSACAHPAFSAMPTDRVSYILQTLIKQYIFLP